MAVPAVPSAPWKRWSVTTALVLGLLTLGIVIWTVVPPPVVTLLPPSIVAAELAPWFVVAGLAIGLLALPRSGSMWRGWRIAALACAAAVTVISAIPVVQVAGARDAAAAAMTAGFGNGPATAAARDPRPVPVSLLDVLGGLHIPPVVVDRAVPISAAGGAVLADGTRLACDVYRATGNGPHPVLITIHGGGWNGGVRQEGATWNRYLAARGFVVVAIDYRLAPSAHYPSQVDDVRAAIAWIRAHAADYDADPRNLVLLGRSAGAQLAMVTAWTTDAGIRGVVDLYGPVDMVVGYEQPAKHDLLDVRQLLIQYLGGTPGEFRERYVDASPITHARRRGPPTLMLYGTRDNVVEIKYGRLLFATLRAHGTPVALVEIPWADHAFDVVPNGLAGQLALYHLERFLAWVTAPGTAPETAYQVEPQH